MEHDDLARLSAHQGSDDQALPPTKETDNVGFPLWRTIVLR